FVVDLPFYGASNVGALMNLDKWKGLGADLQKEIVDATAEFEPKMIAHFKSEQDKEWKELEKLVTRVKFSDAENKKYLDTAYDIEWGAIAQRVSPDLLAQLKK